MEEYKVGNNDNISEYKIGRFSEIVLKKYELKFGPNSKKQLLLNGRNIVDRIFSKDYAFNNLLLVGKVQSGKTSNLELLTAIMFDSGYDLLIMYGGYDTKLLNQTYKRFIKTFNYEEDDDLSPLIISTSDVKSLDESIFNYCIKIKRPIIIISMKRPKALRKINNILENLNIKIKSFIIDDEGDQASLNTEIRKNGKSATYSAIEKMKIILNNPPYISVTATPHANVLLGEYSVLKPDVVVLIPPAPNYTGSSTFHLDESKIIVVPDSDVDFMDQGEFVESLRNAIYHFIISSAIMKKKGITKADMIIHSYREVTKHNSIYIQVSNFIETLKNTKRIPFEENTFLDEMKNVYNSNYFEEDILKEFSFSSLLSEYEWIIDNTHIVLQNGLGKLTQELNYVKPYKIYIGGDLLQRGLTFEHLVTTFFTRWAKQGNMDTVIQRARWFGYRSDYIKLCRIFTTKEIMFEFAYLATSEQDLWEQLSEVENGSKSLDDIIIDATKSSLLPTRPNVATYEKVSFNTKWKNQRIGVFDTNIIKQNNTIIEEFISKQGHNWKTSTVGRRDNQVSCYYCYVDCIEFIDLVNRTQVIFDNRPFNKSEILNIVKGNKVVIELMFDPNDPQDVRKRTFDNECRISALQQGADTEDENKKKYEGDSHVIVDKGAVCVQVFKILSKEKIYEADKYTQYMFSIYVPYTYHGYKKVDL